MPTPLLSKAAIRAEVLSRRNALTPAAVVATGEAVAARVQALPCYARANVVAGYADFRHEVPTLPLLRAALTAGKTVVLPRTWPGERRLTLHRVDDLHQLGPGPFGLREPAADAEEIAPELVECYLIPGVAFDTQGTRLGYGAGYYDSLLAGRAGWRVALAHTCQIVPPLPAAPHDVPMHLIVTETGLIDCALAGTDLLRLRDMTFYGHHGAFPQERASGIRLAVDVDLHVDLRHAILTDDLTTTVNYPAVYALINRIQSQREFHLFEALAGAIADAILTDFPLVAALTVRARKFHPPIGGLMDAFEVELHRDRAAWRR